MSKYPSKIDLNKYEKKWMKYKSVFMHKICELYMNIPGILEQKRNFNVFAGSDYWDQILQNDKKIFFLGNSIILKMQWHHEKYRFWYIYKMFSKFIFWLGYGKKYFSIILKNSISIIWSSKNTGILCSRTLVLACSCSKSQIYTFHFLYISLSTLFFAPRWCKIVTFNLPFLADYRWCH